MSSIKSNITNTQVRMSKSYLKAYYGLNAYLATKTCKSSYFEQIVTNGEELFSCIIRDIGLPKSREIRPQMIEIVVFYFVSLQKRISFLLSHIKYIGDYDMLVFKVQYQKECLRSIIDDVCKDEFRTKKEEIALMVKNLYKYYIEQKSILKEKLSGFIPNEKMKLIDKDPKEFMKVRVLYNQAFSSVVEVFTSPKVLDKFSDKKSVIEELLMLITEFQWKDKTEKMEQLLEKIACSEEEKSEQFYQNIRKNLQLKSQKEQTPVIQKKTEYSPSSVVVYVILFVLILAGVVGFILNS